MRLRLAGIVLMGAGLAGCDTELDNDREPVNQAAPLVLNTTLPVNAAGPAVQPKILKNDRFSVPRETATPPIAPPPAQEYRAIGTEPFWAVTVRGTVAIVERPDHAPVRFTVAKRDEKRTIGYIGDGFDMTIGEGPCSDGMSDAVWHDRVALAFADGTLNGCGGARDEGDGSTP